MEAIEAENASIKAVMTLPSPKRGACRLRRLECGLVRKHGRERSNRRSAAHLIALAVFAAGILALLLLRRSAGIGTGGSAVSLNALAAQQANDRAEASDRERSGRLHRGGLSCRWVFDENGERDESDAYQQGQHQHGPEDQLEMSCNRYSRWLGGYRLHRFGRSTVSLASCARLGGSSNGFAGGLASWGFERSELRNRICYDILQMRSDLDDKRGRLWI